MLPKTSMEDIDVFVMWQLLEEFSPCYLDPTLPHHVKAHLEGLAASQPGKVMRYTGVRPYRKTWDQIRLCPPTVAKTCSSRPLSMGTGNCFGRCPVRGTVDSLPCGQKKRRLQQGVGFAQSSTFCSKRRRTICGRTLKTGKSPTTAKTYSFSLASKRTISWKCWMEDMVSPSMPFGNCPSCI